MTLAELLDFPGPDGVKTVLLSFLQGGSFRITDWESGGVLRTMVELESTVISDLLDSISIQVAGGFLESAGDDWLTALAHGWYQKDRLAAVVAQQTATMVCAAGYGPYAINTLNVLGATDGARYFSATTGTLPSGGTLAVTAVAESPGAAHGLLNTSITPLPGVTVTPGTITVLGSDGERDDALGARCDARWPSFDVATDAPDRVVKWAKAGSTEVTRVRLDNDPVNPGGVLATVAGSGGAITGGALIAVQAWIDARAPITDYITAQNASTLVITAGGTVTVPAALAEQIKATADAAWIAFLAVAPIGGFVRLSRLIQIVMDAGAIDYPNATLGGGVGDIALSTNQVPVPDGAGLPTLLLWQPV
jgi:hypothetical protein